MPVRIQPAGEPDSRNFATRSLDSARSYTTKASGYATSARDYAGENLKYLSPYTDPLKEAGEDTLLYLKKKYDSWLNEDAPPNLMLLISDVLYLGLTVAVLILVTLIITEHADDFKRNSFYQYKVTSTGGVALAAADPLPCGLPTPDGMYLLQALGAVAGAGWDGASLEPNYQKWMLDIDRALCSRLIPGVDTPAPFASTDVNGVTTLSCTGAGTTYGVTNAEELLAIGHLMNNNLIIPSMEDILGSDVTAKTTLFEKLGCLREEDDDKNKPFYSDQQRDSYGDLKERVARSYLTAMPAFTRYANEKATCMDSEEGMKNPFDGFCTHGCHLEEEMHAAWQDRGILVGGEMPEATTFTKQLYRLLALSLVGYYDRYHNSGACFKNLEDSTGVRKSALAFCADSMGVGFESTTPTTDNGAPALLKFSLQDTKVRNSEQCVVGEQNPPPPPPAPPIVRQVLSSENEGFQICASTLQYGLIEQGRLFGIPDIISPFVVDNRVHRSAHFIAWWIYRALYLEPEKQAGDTLADPKAKLELYIAYRLSSSSIWAILVANVAGFMMIRALIPTIVHAGKLFGISPQREDVAKEIARKETGQKFYEKVTLMRPQVEWVDYATMGVLVLTVYWLMWLDPATQSHYYVTKECTDWAGLGVQVPSGAYVTSWGKKRFDRYGEHVIGVLLILVLVVFLFQQIIGRKFITNEERRKSAKVIGKTAKNDAATYLIFGFAISVEILFIAQSIVSGDKWFNAIKANDGQPHTLDDFSKDLIMSVWAAFWASGAFALYRQKWSVEDLPMRFNALWGAACIVAAGMPILQSYILLEEELTVAWTDGKGTKDTDRQGIFATICVVTGFWVLLLAFLIRRFLKAKPDAEPSITVDKNLVEDVKDSLNDTVNPGGTKAPAGKRSSRVVSFKFNLADERMHSQMPMPMRFGERCTTVYTPLMPHV